jgi:hypothetical protein
MTSSDRSPPEAPPARRMPRAFLARGVLAAAGAVALGPLHATGALAVAAWSAVAFGVGTELLASLVFLARRRALPPWR